MTPKTVMLTGAAAMAIATGATTAPMAVAEPIPAAFSYADLLQPLPDAAERLRLDDAAGPDEAHLIPAQLNIGIGVGHHHHHHHHSARWYRSHGFYWNGQVWIQGPPPRPHHHHHHHHQNYR